jgi:hypothetical protein
LILSLFTLLFSLFTSCNNPFDQPQLKSPEAGKGYFLLTIDGASRTIMPTDAIDEFAGGFRLEFFAAGEGPTGTPAKTVEWDSGILSGPVLLDAGNYDLQVSAFADEEKTIVTAQGELEGIVINEAEPAKGTVTLVPVEGGPLTEGKGTFSWGITYPETVTAAMMTVTPLSVNGTAKQTLYFKGGTPLQTAIDNADSLTLNSGYYRVVFRLQIGNTFAERREILHIYQNMDSFYEFTFEADHFVESYILVTTEANSGTGSLRQAITDVAAGGTIIVNDDVKTIALTARLEITKSMTIEGNSVTITRDATWTTENSNSQLMYINSATAEVTIRRVWFKDGRAVGYGAAITINAGTVYLESCIFSGNRNSSSNAYGGAIYKAGTGTLNVKSSTFYNNSANPGRGGAIYNNAGTLTLTGNLFYGNTVGVLGGYVYGPVVYPNGGTVTSKGYNVVDVALGITAGNGQSGFASATGDKRISVIPVSGTSFRLLFNSGAANVIGVLPEDYPAEDFYGTAISNGAAAGAVQGRTANNYYHIEFSVNNAAVGTLGTYPLADADGLYAAGTVSVTANMGAGFSVRWLIDGADRGSDNPLQLTLTAHATVRAVFERERLVTIYTDVSGSAATTQGTLRHALTSDVQDGDIIRFKDAGQTIALTERLPNITKNITIDGNSVTLTRAATWKSEDDNSQLMYISPNIAAEVTVSRVWFKDGRAERYGGAIQTSGNGTVNLESCIFSGNRTTGNYGGAVSNRANTLNVRGCTFYDNNSENGGAICQIDNNTTTYLTGNLFYGNTGSVAYPAVYTFTGDTRSNGYNVVDAALRDASFYQSPGVLNPNDRSITAGVLPLSPVNFKIVSGGPAANIIATLPANYPKTDFYGDPITNGAAAGAVQSALSGSGYILAITVNNSGGGSVSTNVTPNDGLYTGTVTITASPVAPFILKHWLVNGIRTAATGNTLQLTLSENTSVRAVFAKEFVVNNFASDSENVAGTLRHAITNALDEDTIRIGTAGQTIELGSQLPFIQKGITIEGNGVTITRASTWTDTNNISQLMLITSQTAEVTISRVWFKDGKATTNGGAVYISTGTVTLESCIFSGNQTSDSSALGGAIYKAGTGTLNVKGCTFYNNSSAGRGGAIFNNAGTLTLTGNLFYGNTANNTGPIVYRLNGTVTSNGYNVVDVALVAVASGTYTDNPLDTTIAALLGDNATTPFANETTLAPKSQLSIIPASFAGNMPAVDFYGVSRTWMGSAGAVK